MKLIELFNSELALKKLYATALPVSLGFKINLNIRQIKPVVEDFKKNRLEIYKKYGELKDNSYELPKEQPEVFEKALKKLEELNNTEIELQLQGITLEEFRDVKISPEILEKIEYMIAL